MKGRNRKDNSEITRDDRRKEKWQQWDTDHRRKGNGQRWEVTDDRWKVKGQRQDYTA